MSSQQKIEAATSSVLIQWHILLLKKVATANKGMLKDRKIWSVKNVWYSSYNRQYQNFEKQGIILRPDTDV